MQEGHIILQVINIMITMYPVRPYNDKDAIKLDKFSVS